jgi:preprotein translocase subunit SecE
VDDEPRKDEVELAMASDEQDEHGIVLEDDDESLRIDEATLATYGGQGNAVAIPTRRPAREFVLPSWMYDLPLVGGGVRFVDESRIELMKVTWPTRSEAWNMTLVVIALSAAVAVLLGVADIILTHVLSWVLSI